MLNSVNSTKQSCFFHYYIRWAMLTGIYWFALNSKMNAAKSLPTMGTEHATLGLLKLHLEVKLLLNSFCSSLQIITKMIHLPTLYNYRKTPQKLQRTIGMIFTFKKNHANYYRQIQILQQYVSCLAGS